MSYKSSVSSANYQLIRNHTHSNKMAQEEDSHSQRALILNLLLSLEGSIINQAMKALPYEVLMALGGILSGRKV